MLTLLAIFFPAIIVCYIRFFFIKQKKWKMPNSLIEYCIYVFLMNILTMFIVYYIVRTSLVDESAFTNISVFIRYSLCSTICGICLLIFERTIYQYNLKKRIEKIFLSVKSFFLNRIDCYEEKQKSISRVSIEKRIYVFIIFTLLITKIVLAFIRCFFGAELTDQAYAVTEPYIVAKGGIPYVTLWSQMPGWALFLAPFSWIYTTVKGSTEGYYVYFWFIFLITSCFVAFVGWSLLKRQISPIFSVLFCIPILRTVVTRGDGIASDCLFLSSILLSLSIIEEKRKISRATIAGFLGCVASFCHAQSAVACLIIVFTIFLIERKENRKYVSLTSYLLGALAAGLSLVIYLLIRSGSISTFITGIEYCLSNVAYFKLISPISNIASVTSLIMLLLKITIAYLVIPIIVFLLLFLFIKMIGLIDLKKDRIIYIAVALGLITALVIDIRLQSSQYMYWHLFLSVPMFLFLIKAKKRFAQLLTLLIWIPLGIWTLVVMLTAYASPINRLDMLGVASYLAFLFSMMAYRDTFDGIKMYFKRWICIIALLPTILTVGYGFWHQFDMYREDPIQNLTYVIDKGVYKGIHTTDDRAKALRLIEDKIREYTDENDRLLCVDNVPFGYLMSDAQPCTACSWDQSLYSYHFNLPGFYTDYFSITGKMPTTIVYVDYGRDEIMSIDTDDYLFNDFVNENYELVYENRKAYYPVLIYKITQ